MTEEQWTKKYMAPMVGCKVVSVGVNEDEFPFFVLEKPAMGVGKKRRFVVEVSQDEEGNGPGFLFGLPDKVA